MSKKMGNDKRKSRRIGRMLIAILLVVVLGIISAYVFRLRVKSGCEKAMASATESNRRLIVQELNRRIVYLDVLARQLGGNEGDDSRLPDMGLVKEMSTALEVGIYFDQDNKFYLSDGRCGSFSDSEMRDGVEDRAYAVMTREVPELGNVTCLTVVLPVRENDKVTGMVFGYFDIKDFIAIFSKAAYEDNGFSFLADRKGNVVVPATAFSEIDENGRLIISGGSNFENINELVGSIYKDGKIKLEVKQDKKKELIYGVPLENYTDLVIISIVDAEVVYKNVLRVTLGISGATAFLVLLLLFQCIFMLRSERNKKREIANAVNYDELTGLPNKAYHKQQCKEILKKNRRNYAYVVMDISDFSSINAVCGYEYGNSVLKNIAKVLEEECEKNECYSRTSADHFALLLKYENQDKLMIRLYDICEKAGSLPEDIKPIQDNKKENIIFNCGVYLISGNNEDINRIRARANTARKNLRRAINTQIAFYNDDDFRKKMENHELEMDLLKAVDNKEMVVLLQPKYGAVSEEMTGAEALVRWNHPMKGMLGPNYFIGIAEHNGYVKVIDFYVFDTVCRQLKAWKEKGYREIPVSVNFSRLHLYDEDFVQKMVETADRYGIDHKYLEIELTETADFNDMNELLNVMYRIKEAGFGLAMDDFGSGYSSLQLLMKMPRGVLKMDKSLIDDCSRDNEMDNKMAANIISLAQGRGHRVVAEGVETEEQKDILRDANCDTIQGYYYSKPISIEEFELLMTK